MTAAPDGDVHGPMDGARCMAHPCAAEERREIAGLRERKKRRTRLALIDAALDLFLEKGYDATTIDEIVAAVEVSQRTFFRYFATKEDVVTAFLSEYDKLMAEALAARPVDERPFTALLESLRVVLRTIVATGGGDSARFRRIRQVLESTPALEAAQTARYSAAEKTLAAEIARREGLDATADLRPHFIVAFHTAAARVAFEDCARHDIWDPETVAARVEESLALAVATMREWT
ncbi:TetR family transcriptional regulator [Actinomadura litoris]|uniref:TetR family transcriptional regulator n=1 Tax=Actinomadura litoris TaxID=2678616 RepID=UPI001FA813A2|nr:TetR family transcriptional regulator [Actinomadura litoris]